MTYRTASLIRRRRFGMSRCRKSVGRRSGARQKKRATHIRIATHGPLHRCRCGALGASRVRIDSSETLGRKRAADSSNEETSSR
jgi:hypothetical protein